MRRALRSFGTLTALAACTGPRPGADSAATRADTVVPVPAPPAAVDSMPAPAVAPPADTVTRPPTPPAGRPPAPPTPATTDSASRPRLTPRPPRPVPRPMPRGEDTTPGIRPGGGSQADDQAALDRLMREAKALARVEGCSAAGQCAVQALGARACGGPEDYVVYCPRSTDVAALKAKAAELERAQKAFNAKYELVSTCEFRQPPTASLLGGSCRAARAGGAPAVPR